MMLVGEACKLASHVFETNSGLEMDVTESLMKED